MLQRFFAALGEIGQSRRKRRAANAIAEDVDLLDPRLLLNGTYRFEDALKDVVFEVFAASRSSGLTQDTTNTVKP